LKPVILLNRNRPSCRQRFSLAHELGHVVLHAYHSEGMEVEANRFAAELLMPAKDILPDLRQPLSLPRLGKLKLKWRTSMSSILYRAKEVGAIDEWQSKNLWISLSSSGYRLVEPIEFDAPRERSKTLRALIDLHTDDLGYGLIELAALLETHHKEFLEMAELQPTMEMKRKQLQLKVVVDNSGRTKQN
jgi:Zn-dependent peptidase ImmA (M78 family)